MVAIDRKQPKSVRPGLLLLLSLGATLALLVGLGAWAFASLQSGRHESEIAQASQSAFEEATGVQLVRIAVTAGGGMLDLRYRVLDPDKAIVVHDKQKPPTIIDESSGKSTSRPWMPHHSNKDLKSARTYYELIVNPGGIIRRGDRVTLVVGETRLAHVIVQ
jgi:hypothetical protein